MVCPQFRHEVTNLDVRHTGVVNNCPDLIGRWQLRVQVARPQGGVISCTVLVDDGVVQNRLDSALEASGSLRPGVPELSNRLARCPVFNFLEQDVEHMAH